MELDALVIAPHPDDAELGMGGGILNMLAAGRKVGVLDLTNGEPTPHGSPEIRASETDAATKVLGLSWRENLGLTNRSLEATLDARAKLAGVFRMVRPKWLFAPFVLLMVVVTLRYLWRIVSVIKYGPSETEVEALSLTAGENQ